MLVPMARLISAEVARVELAMLGMDARPRAGPLVHEEPNDRRVRRAEASRQVHRIPLGVPPFLGKRVLIEGRERWTVLFDAAPDPLGEDLGGVGDVTHDLDRGPVTEPHGPEAIGAHRPDDARKRRGIVGEREGTVLVVSETVHGSTLAKF